MEGLLNKIPDRVGVIGSGSWGTALAILLSGKGIRVTMWGHLQEEMEEIQATRENRIFLPGHRLRKAALNWRWIKFLLKEHLVID